ncbi:MAG: type IV pilus assembly protein PilM [Planctomycetota bacterium]|nr:MAG: type IV pilus assembly protein PilM [Planctomycetota bacterium]
MAKSGAVWGIDIGQCAVKALRCQPGETDDVIVADAFDYIEYPKILSQPDADPAELVREALELFLSRNTVRGDKVAISVSGQSGLARFIKLPPVESKKIPDIVKYEARQQIPFALEDVVWDYQQMQGGSEEDGFALETEVGLFAMKRDQAERALKPFDDAGIEVDIVQLTPLAIYNFTVFDQMNDLPPAEEYDPENPPESIVVISLGTDTTDLVITNGYRVWQRSIALGGSHFTKALTKELRLTFAKAEHLKKNASQAEDPKAVFQAMRPVFNDLLTQIQRSIGYFTSIDRDAKIGRVIALGNAMKLPGLQKYLSQNLGQNVAEVKGYRGLNGPTVVDAPAFKSNLLSFPVCYGLALQGMDKSSLSTNLLPPEILTDRMIREKKPWAVAMVAMLLLGITINFLGHWRAWNSVHPERFSAASSAADQASSMASSARSDYEAQKAKFEEIHAIGEGLVSNVEGRFLWLELIAALNQCLPSDPPGERPEEIGQREEIHITGLDCEWYPDLATWYSSGIGERIQAAKQAEQAPGSAGGADTASPDGQGVPPESADPFGAAANGAGPGPGAPPGGTPDTGPTGPGWVIELRGYHYHNEDRRRFGAAFVRDTLVENLREKEVQVLDRSGNPTTVPVSDLGISHPVILTDDVTLKDETIEDRTTGEKIPVKVWHFTLQFAWSPTTISEREENKAQADAALTAVGGQ